MNQKKTLKKELALAQARLDQLIENLLEADPSRTATWERKVRKARERAALCQRNLDRLQSL